MQKATPAGMVWRFIHGHAVLVSDKGGSGGGAGGGGKTSKPSGGSSNVKQLAGELATAQRRVEM
jgi:hypothetical protein